MELLVSNERAFEMWPRSARRTPDPELCLAVLDIAQRWAELMERRLTRGETIADIAMDTLRIAAPNTDAFDPYTRWGDLIADYFEECWFYGPAFRRWYGASRYR